MYPSFTSNGAMRCFLGIKSIFLPPTSMIPNLSGSAGDTENVLCMKGVAILKFYSAAIFSLTQFFSHITAWQCISSPRAIFCDSLTDDIKQESYNWILTSPRVFTLLKLSLPRGRGGRGLEKSHFELGCYCRYPDLISLYSVFQMQSSRCLLLLVIK